MSYQGKEIFFIPDNLNSIQFNSIGIRYSTFPETKFGNSYLSQVTVHSFR